MPVSTRPFSTLFVAFALLILTLTLSLTAILQPVHAFTLHSSFLGHRAWSISSSSPSPYSTTTAPTTTPTTTLYNVHPQLKRRRLATAVQRRRPSRSFSTSAASLVMHMGHSHSHHHHDDSSSHAIVHVQTMARKRRRRMAMFVFCAVATLGPRLVLKRRALRNADVAAFLVSSLALASVDKVRRETKSLIDKVRGAWKEVAKHSPPLSSYEQRDPATRVTIIGVFINLFLSVGKLAVGLASHSSALIADAGHSLSDLFSDFVTLYTVQIARLPPDDDHPYGHGKFEAIGSLFLALTLLATGVSVGAMSNKNLLHILSSSSRRPVNVALPKPPALIMAALSILSKEWLYRITKRVGLKLNSQVVLANAWHHRSDAYSSVLALISIGLAMFVPGLLAADSFAGLLVAGMICMTGADILGESIKQLSDHNPKEVVQRVTQLVEGNEHVEAVDQIRARQVGSQAWVDVKLTLSQSNSEAVTVVEERIRRQILDDLTDEVILDAEVRAVLSNEKVIGANLNNGDMKPPVPVLSSKPSSPSAIYSEDDIKAQVRVCSLGAPGIASVESVTVQQPNSALEQSTVDVTIRVQQKNGSLPEAREFANRFRDSLQDLPSISQAKIYLDLNEVNSAIVATTRVQLANGDHDHEHNEHAGETAAP